MKVLLLDPGLSAPYGHNAFLARELQLALEGVHQLTIAGPRSLSTALQAQLGGAAQPSFELEGYAGFAGAQLRDLTQLAALRAKVDADLDALAPERYDAILMPTAYPLHLDAWLGGQPSLSAAGC